MRPYNYPTAPRRTHRTELSVVPLEVSDTTDTPGTVATASQPLHLVGGVHLDDLRRNLFADDDAHEQDCSGADAVPSSSEPADVPVPASPSKSLLEHSVPQDSSGADAAPSSSQPTDAAVTASPAKHVEHALPQTSSGSLLNILNATDTHALITFALYLWKEKLAGTLPKVFNKAVPDMCWWNYKDTAATIFKIGCGDNTLLEKAYRLHKEKQLPPKLLQLHAKGAAALVKLRTSVHAVLDKFEVHNIRVHVQSLTDVKSETVVQPEHHDGKSSNAVFVATSGDAVCKTVYTESAESQAFDTESAPSYAGSAWFHGRGSPVRHSVVLTKCGHCRVALLVDTATVPEFSHVDPSLDLFSKELKDMSEWTKMDGEGIAAIVKNLCTDENSPSQREMIKPASKRILLESKNK
eukprot:m.425268 g.425268  ORF g.425268 m.425268 type:complete len:409 (-) comp51694_c0_seq1:119-1345(-)